MTKQKLQTKKSRSKTKTKTTYKYHLPQVIKSKEKIENKDFPLKHYSYSSFVKFSSNPFMFKVNNINGDYLDTASSPSSVLGKACHKALCVYFGGDPSISTPANEGEAIQLGYEKGMDFLNNYADGFIEYNTVIPTRQKLLEKFSFAYFGYVKEFNVEKHIENIVMVEKEMNNIIEIDGKLLPVPLKGFADLVYKDKKGRLIIRDHKFTSAYSALEKIDGAKLLQSAFMYLLVYAELGEKPYSIVFAEFKTSENRDKSPQMKEYEMIFEENSLIFDLFYRFYDDVTNALLGKQVYVPNINALYDNEVGILAYIHRLDVDEERARKFKELKVDNITDFLKKQIVNEVAMKRYLEAVSQKFVSGTTMNYKEKTIEERIKMKLAEHGLAVDFYDKVVGNSITLYRFEPSIGLKMSKIEAFVKDVEQVVEVSNIRILAPIPNSSLVGFEIPNSKRTFPELGKIKEDGYNILIGKDAMGKNVKIDITEAPHLLIAGSTGSGKSVLLTSIIKQLGALENTDLILIDPKMVELSHISNPNVIKYADETGEIINVFKDLVVEMNRRYKLFKDQKCRNIKEYGKLNRIFVLIDEYGDICANEFIKKSLLLLAQKARASGIHIILTTQRPSINIIDGDIKMNFSVRIAFKTATQVDSQVILDQTGAEKLLGKGDLLLKTHDDIQRLQGFLVK